VIDPLRVACPHCQAPPEENCQTTVRRLPLIRSHRVRWVEAKWTVLGRDW
jgi:hypothetical protein